MVVNERSFAARPNHQMLIVVPEGDCIAFNVQIGGSCVEDLNTLKCGSWQRLGYRRTVALKTSDMLLTCHNERHSYKASNYLGEN